MSVSKTEPGPLSRPLRVEDVPERGLDVKVTPNADELNALSRDFGLVGIDRLEGQFHVTRKGKDAFVKGRIAAGVTQICVVTLESFSSEVVEDVEVQFSPNAPALDDENAPLDAPDPIVDGMIDLGQITAEFLVLGLDPYPRKPGASFAFQAAEAAENPFAVLKKLRPEE
jgi:uncharacterized metal-binding protein YceD (DUF177 family)